MSPSDPSEDFPNHGEPEPEKQSEPVVFSMTVSGPSVDYMLERHGLVPSKELRLTMAQEFRDAAPFWLDKVVERASEAIKSKN